MNDIDEMVVRVGKAHCADRAIDLALHALFERPGWTIEKIEYGLMGDRITWGPVTDSTAGDWPHEYCGDWPRYTASIDAALALVEKVLPGWGLNIFLCEAEAKQLRPAIVSMFKKGAGQHHASPEFEFEASGATIPLAILSALLSALRAKRQEPA